MDLNDQRLRLEGVYRQNDRGEFMQRVKLAGGVLSTTQAQALADLGGRFGSGVLHLSTRGSIEFHGLQAAELMEVHRELTAVGLYSRGACGGAVRGISCSSSFGPGFGRTQVMLRHFMGYFSGNPYFEGLPKKFKMAFEAGYERSRHLIQDLAFVLVDEAGEDSRYDVWIAGGLGREPQPGFLLADRMPEPQLLPLAEAVVEVYKRWGEKGRRLKHLLQELGEEELRRRINLRCKDKEAVAFTDAFPKALLPDERCQRVPLNVFAGELPALKMKQIAALAEKHNSHWLLVTPDQNIEILLEGSTAAIEQELIQTGFELLIDNSVLRICPGNHDCRMGLSATRDLARRLQNELGAQLTKYSFAISGCRNSCAQPQLADFGILASKMKREGDLRTPLYDLYRRSGDGFGVVVASELNEEELINCIKELVKG
jgi:sulfite reductase beta subunit-like hemoprotein